MRWSVLCSTLLLAIGCSTRAHAPAPDGVVLPLAEEPDRPGHGARRVAEMSSLTGDSSSLLAVPATVRRGDSIAVELTTTGGGCTEDDTTVTTMVGMTAQIVPYQRYVAPVRPHGYCVETLRLSPPRVVWFVFDSIGQVRVTVVYRDLARARLRTFERRIAVQ